MIEKAIIFATEKHLGVKRKYDNVPYIVHPIFVAYLVSFFKRSKNFELLFVAALLHDVVEDCGVTIEEIKHLFGSQVADLVQELTSDPEQIKVMGKTEYLKQKMTNMSSYALRLKLCDRLHNVIDLTNAPEKVRLKTFKQTQEIIEHLEKTRKLTLTHKKIISAIQKNIS